MHGKIHQKYLQMIHIKYMCLFVHFVVGNICLFVETEF